MSMFPRSSKTVRNRLLGTTTALGLVIAGALGAQLADSGPAHANALFASEAIAPYVPQAANGQPFSFADLVAHVAPAVVSVKVEAKLEMAAMSGDAEEFMRRFYEQFGQPMPSPDQGADPDGNGLTEGMGSGFVIDAAGFIVTNNHVIDKAEKITIVFSDGKELDAKLIGTDPGTDIALLKVESSTPLPFVPVGDDSKLRPGDWVVAVGNPFGLGGTVTAGILSARGRNIGAGPYTDYLQIDAPINRGNSGGPAFNLAGEVIGVNSAIYTPSGGSVGIGFAVPASTVTKVVAQLRETGSVKRGWLGVQIQPLDKDMAEAAGLPDSKGALVSMVTKGSPAETAGFQAGDIVRKANGQDMADNRVLARFVAELAIGQTASFEVWRNGATQTLTATIAVRDEDKLRAELGGKPSDPASPQGSEALPGVQLSALTDEIRRGMDVPAGTEGLVVTKVAKGSDAASKGITEGDIIVAVGNQPVKAVADVTAAVGAAKGQGRKSVLILLERRGVRQYLAVNIG